MSLSIGIDFDNTIACYDDLIREVALDWGLVGPRASRNKKQIRDEIRRLPRGDIQWQKVQAEVYGPRMSEAAPAQGVLDFFANCALRDTQVWIVSHKTEFANYDTTGTNLRTAALDWLSRNSLIGSSPTGIPQENVFFEPTRQEKLERIRRLECSHFIDDLVETFLEKDFPAQVEKILYSHSPVREAQANVALAGDWPQIASYLFDDGS